MPDDVVDQEPVAHIVPEPHDDDVDPIDQMRHEHVRSLADSFAMHAELLKEQRALAEDLRQTIGTSKEAADRNIAAADRLGEFLTHAEEHAKDVEPVVHKPTDSSFGGRGW